MEAPKLSLLPEETKYFNRDLSWLSFNYRVLQEAMDPTVPLFEKIKFLAIFSSNLDEFFRVRVASLRGLSKVKKKHLAQELDSKPRKLLKKILKTVDQHQKEFGVIWKGILNDLRKKGIILYRDELSVEKEHLPIIDHYFKSRIAAFIQPVFYEEETKPLFLENRHLYLAVELIDTRNQLQYAVINIPSDHLDRYFMLPTIGNKHYLITLDDIIRLNLNFMFSDFEVQGCYSIKLNRDADLNIDDEFTGDLVRKIKKHLSQRDIGVPSRFLYDNEISNEFLNILSEWIELNSEDLVQGGRYHNMSDLIALPNPLSENLSDPVLIAIKKKVFEQSDSIFDAIVQEDQLLHFPYQSYDYVLRFFSEASLDKSVKEIYATFYRVAQDSFIVNSLISAAKNGKKVTVFIEVKARFDEANNLYWADQMEQAGIKIKYSIPGLKVHAKVALVKKKTPDGKIIRYAFLGTGNFNEKTAGLYADHGLLTCNTEIGKELEALFKYLRKQKQFQGFKHLLVSQFNLKDKFLELIDREIVNIKKGEKAGIIIKVNNLEEREMIDKLYEASKAGVNIRLITRSICSLIPGVKGMSENIEVTRLVDRYLEHARIFIFQNSGNQEIYLGSADWMNRNIHHRIEVIFPLLNKQLQEELKMLIKLQLKDTVKARLLDESQHNQVKLSKANETKIRAQVDYYKWLKRREEAE